MALPLDRLLKPRSIAIVGASDKPGALGASVRGNLERLGFSGGIHLINPKRDEIGGRPCLKAIDDLPDGVDVAVLAIPRDGVLDAVRALAARGVGAAVIFSAGFAEGGAEGVADQRELVRIAAETGMVIEGPNCLGFVNFVDGVPLTFIETAPANPDRGRGIGIVSQSGAIAAVVGTSLLSRSLSLSYSISTGNEAASGIEDYLDYLIDDPATDLIGMVVEQIRQPRRFLAAAARAEAADKPIVLLHPGRSAAARKSAETHTGAMAGDYPLMKAKVERAGVVLVETLEELGDCLELLARCGPLGGKGSLVIGESGAFKALMLDFAETVGLALPAAEDSDSPALRAALPGFVPVSNPIDMTAQGLVEPAIYSRLVSAAVADERFDTVILGIIQTDETTCRIKFPAILAAVEAAGGAKPVICAGLDDGAPIPRAYVDALRRLGVPHFPSTERVLRAVSALSRQARRDRSVSPPGSVAVPDLPDGVVPEYACKAILGPLGIPFPVGCQVATLDEALSAADSIGYPLVLKAQSVDLSHKSDVGGVIVGLADHVALVEGWAALHANIERHRPDLMLEGILIEAMGGPGLELIVGGRNDPDWGPILLAGFGGVHAEVLHDACLLPPDLGKDGIVAALRRLRSGALLDGVRGAPARDLDAAADIIVTLGRLLQAAPAIREVDLNPVVLFPAGGGAMALDALMLVERHRDEKAVAITDDMIHYIA